MPIQWFVHFLLTEAEIEQTKANFFNMTDFSYVPDELYTHMPKINPGGIGAKMCRYRKSWGVPAYSKTIM